MKPFSIGDSLKFGWEKIRAHSRVVFPCVLILAAVQIALRFGSTPVPTVGSGAVTLFGFVLSIVFGAGFTIITLKLSRGEPADVRDIIPPGRLLWQYFIASVAVGGIVLGLFLGLAAIGALLGLLIYGLKLPTVLTFGLIVIGVVAGLGVLVWVLLRYFFVKLTAIDGGEHRVKETLGKSVALTEGIKWQLLLFLIVIALINIVGTITIIGLLLSIPVTMFATIDVYLKLLGQPKASSSGPASALTPSGIE